MSLEEEGLDISCKIGALQKSTGDGVCYTPIFDLRTYIHTPSDPVYSLVFQRKIRHKGILKYLIFVPIPAHLLVFFLFSYLLVF